MSKPLILFFPFPLLSHYSRCVIVANSIRNEFEIQFSYDAKFDHLIRKAGYGSFNCENFDSQIVLNDSKKFSFQWINEVSLKKIFLSQVDCISRLKPQLVTGDAAFTLKMAAEKCNVKMIALINGYMSQYYRLTRKIPRMHPANRYAEKVPEPFFDRITAFMENLAFKKVHRPFNIIRRESGLQSKKNYLDELTGDFTFICDLPEFFPQNKLPEHYCVLGPLFYQSDENQTEMVSYPDSGKPVILVSLGSSGNWESLQLLCSDKFYGFNIITSGDEFKILKGPHITGKIFLNHHSILPFAKVMICHGGNGTIYQALAHGVPVLGITSMFEQEWNMQQVKQLGLGESVNDLTGDELLRKIEYWIDHKPKINFVQE
ncbi:MAG: glycosyltransferase, partial [Chitinophagales bacterium]